MVAEMTRDEQLGWFHNHVFKHVEDLWERPLSWVCRLFCCELGKENYKRRIFVTMDNAERTERIKKDVEKNRFGSPEEKEKYAMWKVYQEEKDRTRKRKRDVIQKNRAAKLELALFVALHVGFEIFQRVLDIQKRDSLAIFY